jgi:putative MATE family efflux protein
VKTTVNISSKDILNLAIPAIIAGIAEPLISLTDLVIIGNMKGDTVTALAAVGLVGTFLSAIIWTLAQTKTSISAIVSRAVGDQTIARINGLIPQVIWINITLGVFIYVITAPAAAMIFSWYDAQGQVLEISSQYYKIRAIGFPFTLCAFALFGVFRGLQNTSWAMIASICGAVLNIILDIVLVYGIDGIIPAQGIVGAAYASLCAQILMMFIAVYFLYRKTPFFLKITQWTPHEKFKQHLYLTFNFFVRTLAINSAIYLSYRYANGYGITAAATHAILMNIWLFFSFLVDGFANAGNALGGKLLGSKDAASLKYLARTTTLYGVGMALLLTLICAAFYKAIPGYFTDDVAVIEMMIDVFWIVLVMQPFNAVAFVYDGIFKGWGQAVYLRNLLIILTVVLFIPSLLITDYLGWELKAVWTAFFVWMIGRAVVLFFKFRSRVGAL